MSAAGWLGGGGLIGDPDLQSVLVNRADDETDTILPAHTHTQPAQPVLLTHHLLAYVEMLDRDADRLSDAAGGPTGPRRLGAVAGSGLSIDRDRSQPRSASVASPTTRSMLSRTATTRSRRRGARDPARPPVALAGEIVLWSTPYVGFVRVDDAFSSGSSMLPNKRNPDSAELVRARAARVEGDLVTSCRWCAGCRWRITATSRRREGRSSTRSTLLACAWR